MDAVLKEILLDRKAKEQCVVCGKQFKKEDLVNCIIESHSELGDLIVCSNHIKYRRGSNNV